MDVHYKFYQQKLEAKNFRRKFTTLIHQQPDLIRDKVILNIQASSAWVGMYCAKMGAKKIYVVQENRITRYISKGCVTENNTQQKIKFLKGKMEDVIVPEQVDMIVWDWSSLDDGIFNEILEAKRYLKNQGTIIPEVFKIYSALTELSNILGFENINDVDLYPISNAYKLSYSSETLKGYIDSQMFVSDPLLVTKILLKDLSYADLNAKQYSVVNVATSDCTAAGVAIWCSYNISESDKEPDVMDTTQGNTIIFPHEIDLEEEDPFCYHLIISNEEKLFHCIEFENVEPDKIEHPVGCPCNMLKCVVMSSCLSSPAFN